MMQQAHLSVAASYAGRAWWSPDLVERWRATAAWNGVRGAVRRGHFREAARHAACIPGTRSGYAASSRCGPRAPGCGAAARASCATAARR